MLALLLPLLALASELPPELNTFLGKPPAAFEKKFLQPAKQLKKAMVHVADKKTDAAIKEFAPLSAKGEMAEHASFELSRAYREKKDFAKSTALANRVLYEFPSTPYRDQLQEMVDENDCDQGLKTKSQSLLFRCLQKISWREWADKEPQVTELYNLLKKSKDPLFGPYVAELIQALPASAPLRARIAKEIPNKDLQAYGTMARYRTRTSPPAGVRPTNPDADLFDLGMQAVLEKKWGDANGSFKKLVADFPQSEHLDRAQYWIARSEEALGNADEAKRRYNEIYSENPLSYYGLQSALRLKKDLSLLIAPSSAEPAPLQGTLLPRQAVAIWRLRALMETGLIDQARMEAKALFQYRPGGSTFGQDNAGGAALVALLYHTAGYSMGAFSQAYAAISLDANQLNAFTLDLIFPSNFQKQFEAAGERTGVNPYLLLSVAKQESAFLPNAISRANAFGLMQLLLSTARDIDGKTTREALFDPAVNTQLGSRYLQKLIERFQGNIALALAAYNAGPTRAVQWQKRMLEFSSMKENFDMDTFIDTIPFTETRRYVGSILRNYAWYKLMNKDGTIGTIEELAFQWQKRPREETHPNPGPAPVVEEAAPNPAAPPPLPPTPLVEPEPATPTLSL